jgi:hypothetical protein
MSGRKTVSRSVAIALGMAYIVLTVGLGGAIARGDLIDTWNQSMNQLQVYEDQLALNHLALVQLNEIRALLSPTQTSGNETSGLQLTMTLQKTVFRLGEPINVTLTITNITNQTQIFYLGPDSNDFDFHVYNGTNSDIYWHSSIWLGGAIPDIMICIVLNSTQPWGNSWTESFVWQQNMIAPGTVSPGTYYIVGRTGPPYFLSENSNWETTPIQIAILPSD